MSLEIRPLSAQELPVAAVKLAGPKAPKKLKLLAAKGLAPGVSGPDLACALYQLTLDPDSDVAEQAKATIRDFDASMLERILDQPLPPQVLHVFSEPALGSGKLVEKLLLNKATADETVAAMVPYLDERRCELVARNEQRLLRHPVIIEALYNNPNTRMSTANHCVELAVRNQIQLGLAAYREMAQAIGMAPKEEDPLDQALVEAERDMEFARVYQETADRAEEEDGDDDESGSHRLRIASLSVPEKVRLAILGNAFHRTVLLRDANRLVAMAAIKSPKVTEIEVVRAAKNPQLSEDVLRYIARRKEWVKLYQIKANLVTNPKTPLAIALKILPHLRPKELKMLARSKNIPAALRASAQQRINKARPGR